MHFEPGFIICFLNEGARAFSSKGASIDEIVKAIEVFAAKALHYDEKVQEIIEKDLGSMGMMKNKIIIMAGRQIGKLMFWNYLRRKTNASNWSRAWIQTELWNGTDKNLIGKIKVNLMMNYWTG